MAQISLLEAFKSTATASAQKAVDLIKAKRGAANGFASLDANGKVPASQLPAALDEVIEIKVNFTKDSNGNEVINYMTDVNGNTLSSKDMQQDVLYVNVAENTYANNIYRWSGTRLVLCPTIPKNEDLTVEFEENTISPNYNPDNITSGSTLAILFSTIQKAIASLKYIGSQLQGLTNSFNSHTSDTTKHIKGIDATPTENSQNVVTSDGIAKMGNSLNNTINTLGNTLSGRIAPLEHYIDAPDELPFMEETDFNATINSAMSNVS